MHRHTTWRVGGIADAAFFPEDIDDLSHFLKNLSSKIPVYITGLGSNVLIRDKGFRGIIIITNRAFRALKLDGNFVYAQAGVPSPKLARFAAKNGIEGLEFLAGVPGTIGGALAMNAGCYGFETWEVVDKVRTISREGIFETKVPDDFRVSYRSVDFKSNESEFFVEGWFKGRLGSPSNAMDRIKALQKNRLETQPVQQASAGSVFRNPPGDFAARLIENSGLKGFSIGGAEISRKHANFFINVGEATSGDFERLIEHVCITVKKTFGITLEKEIKIVGEE